jgi:hypothetical protein
LLGVLGRETELSWNRLCTRREEVRREGRSRFIFVLYFLNHKMHGASSEVENTQQAEVDYMSSEAGLPVLLTCCE